ncbi:MAG: histidine--tRNA ligase [Pseudomonadota bacterium]
MSTNSLRGMHDVLPTQSSEWQRLESAVRVLMSAYGYGEMRTPLLEKTALFARGIGEATDIVEKEMYAFDDRNGESIALRPENTAGCVRAAIQHGLLGQGVQRVWYAGPMFRYERPQKGRYRQFHQIGAEVYGAAGATIEAELICLSARLWRALGIGEVVSLELNSLGALEERHAFRDQLVAYFQDHRDQLDEDSLRRLETNPLRILDSKNPTMQGLIAGAPSLVDCFGAESSDHFAAVQSTLDSAGIGYSLNSRLVRGLDYYSHTVFEWTTDRLGAQAAVCGGGRYDGLVTLLGGKASPAVGWAIGMERLLELVKTTHGAVEATPPHAFVVAAGGATDRHAFALGETLRDRLPGLHLINNAIGGSFKAQFKRADKSGAAFALVLADQEMADGTVTVKPLRDGGEQQSMTLDQVVECLAKQISGE